MKGEETMNQFGRTMGMYVKRLVQVLAGTRPIRRATSLVLIYLLLLPPVVSLPVHAETAGATAPEVTKFEPVDTTDLVNLASGDFTYNIPILNVPGPEGGYPLSLNYHSGVAHGEEASWVGLGWNLQPGSIARTVRGYPDDFNNVGIQKQFVSNKTYEYSAGVTFANSVGVGVTYNTSKGFGGYVSLGPQAGGGGIGLNARYYGGGEWAVGIGYTMDNGIGIDVTYGSSGSVGIEAYGSISENSRLGLSAHTDGHGTATVGASAGMSQGVRMSMDSSGRTSVGVNLGQKGGGSGTFSSYTGGGIQSNFIGISIPVGWISVDLGYTEYWIDKTESEQAYGYFNHHIQNATKTRVNEWIMESNPKDVPGDDPAKTLGSGFHYLPSYDSYTVMGQGTGGNIRPTRLRDWVYHPKPVDENWKEAMDWPWPDSNGFDADDPRNLARFVFDGDNGEVIPQDSLNLSRFGLAGRGTDGRGLFLSKILDLSSPDRLIDNPLILDIPALLSDASPLKIASFNDTRADSLYLGKSYRSRGGARIVSPIIDAFNQLFSGFDIWELDGKQYQYREAVFNLWSENVSGNAYSRSGDWFRSRSTISAPFAYAWLLSELRYPDYFDADQIAGVSDGDDGGWVKFSYSQVAQDYRWHTSPDGEFNDGPNNRVREVGLKKAGMMYGMEYGAKQLKYLQKVETATHQALFSFSPRLDAQEVNYTPSMLDGKSSQFPSVDRRRSVQLNKLANGNISITTTEVGPNHEIIDSTYKNVDYKWRPFPEVVNTLAACGIVIDIHQEPLFPKPWKVLKIPPKTRDSVSEYWHQLLPIELELDESYGGISGSLQGIPIKFNKVKIRYNEVVTNPSQWNALPWLNHYCDIKIEFSLSDQFWTTPEVRYGSPLAFQNINNAWNDLLRSAQKNNGVITLSSPSMQKLDDIYLIEKSTNKLVKQVHFEYDYSLCQNTPNSNAPTTSPDPNNPSKKGGKLTLKSVQVFGQEGMGPGSRAKLPPYRFYYANNPDYGSKYAYDRWGFHKSNGAMWQHRDAVAADQDAWDLTRIKLPTGGDLYIQYEPKDYARVQDRRPLNAQANQGMVGNYQVDVPGWLTKMGLTAWPKSDADWDAFLAKVGITPFQTFAPGGDTGAGGVAIPKVTTTLPQKAAPLDSAPIPSDLVRWWNRSDTFKNQQSAAAQKMAITTQSTGMVLPKVVPQAVDVVASEAATIKRNTRMLNVVFEWFTAGNPATSKNRRMTRALKEQDGDDTKDRTEEDRRTIQTFSVLALIATDPTVTASGTNRSNITVIDPDFRWPQKAPSAVYVTWSHPAAKVGGGVRVKRIVASDGLKSFATSYSYRDVVDGEWSTSGVAVVEPPPYGYSADDDRVIFPEFGGWANEKGGGIVHSRVVVRQTWSEDPNPAGILNASGSKPVETPGGESVFRFISPSDLPHRSSSGSVRSVSGLQDRRVKVTEIFNMGAWWGQLLWREDRDAQGRVLQRVENRYTQLDGYLRFFPRMRTSDGMPVGTDTDVEYLYQQNNQDAYKQNDASWVPFRTDRSYDWAEKYSNAGDRPLPSLSDNTTDTLSIQDFRNAQAGYLNASLNVTLAYRTDYATMSSVDLVRELSLSPLISETRTYMEGATQPSSVKKNTVWEGRTGQVLETRTKGRTSPVGTPTDPNEWVINRTWPAYWAYPEMFKRDDKLAGYGMPEANAEGFASGVVNMLSQTTQSTTSRKIPGQTGETYLNSKVETWWQAPGGYAKRWLKGGDFVWNGSGTTPGAFPGYSTSSPWTPALVTDTIGGYQPFKANGWLFAGAVTAYDAYGHALEAVEGDGVFGCSKYGYQGTTDGLTPRLPAGILPVAKFANARDSETIYLNFEDPITVNGTVAYGDNPPSFSDDPLVRLQTAYSGDRAWKKDLSLAMPTSTVVSQYELRYFVKAAIEATAKASYPSTNLTGDQVTAVQVEGGWWLVRGRVASGQTRVLKGTAAAPLDDVSIFPWRRNGAPASVSHFGYDRVLGLVTSITGANGRTQRYRYDKLGRLMTVYDAYGNPSTATRYYHMAN